MKDRIYGLETEYALIHNSDNKERILDKGKIFNLLDDALTKRYKTQSGFSEKSELIELKEGRFIENGARFYYDTGHAEWAAPECRSIKDAVIFDKAGERILEELIPLAEEKMRNIGCNGKILIIKNNVDHIGGTYGCHENYLLQRNINLMKNKTMLNYLITFLVTRQIFSGAGKVGISEEIVSATHTIPYQISQRADFIYCETSDFTAREPDTRAIIDTRDEPLADEDRYRRLHLILGDSNISDWSNFLKLGTTGIVLQMIEDNYLNRDFVLANPIASIKEISYNPTCKIELLLKNGSYLTPVAIQKRYLQMAKDYSSHQRLNQENLQVIEMWEEVLNKLEEDPNLLATKIDWVIKRRLLDQYISEQKTTWDEVGKWNYVITKTKKVIGERSEKEITDIKTFFRKSLPEKLSSLEEYMRIKGLDWKDYFHQLNVYYGLRERDIRYHDINTQNGLFYLLLNAGLVDRLFNANEIEYGKHNPPSNTRANIRGKIIKKASEQNMKVLVDWAKIGLDGSDRIIEIKDPFASSNDEVQKVIDKCFPGRGNIFFRMGNILR